MTHWKMLFENIIGKGEKAGNQCYHPMVVLLFNSLPNDNILD